MTNPTKPTVPVFRAVDAAEYLDESRPGNTPEDNARLDELKKLSNAELEASLKAQQEYFRKQYSKSPK